MQQELIISFWPGLTSSHYLLSVLKWGSNLIREGSPSTARTPKCSLVSSAVFPGCSGFSQGSPPSWRNSWNNSLWRHSGPTTSTGFSWCGKEAALLWLSPEAKLDPFRTLNLRGSDFCIDWIAHIWTPNSNGASPTAYIREHSLLPSPSPDWKSSHAYFTTVVRRKSKGLTIHQSIWIYIS